MPFEIQTTNWLTQAFPNSVPDDFEVIGEMTWSYNCFAYVMDTPYWLSHGHPRDTELMLSMAEERGYKLAWDLNAPPADGVTRIVFYMRDGVIKHGAKQHHDGRWVSKCGSGPLVIHRTLECLNCDNYGVPALVFERSAA